MMNFLAAHPIRRGLVVWGTMMCLVTVFLMLEYRDGQIQREAGYRHDADVKRHAVETALSYRLNWIGRDASFLVNLPVFTGQEKTTLTATREQIADTLQHFLQTRLDMYRQIAYFDQDGREVLRLQSVQGEVVQQPVAVSSQPIARYFEVLRDSPAGQVYLDNVDFSGATDADITQRVIHAAIAVRDAQGHFVGVLRLSYLFKDILQRLSKVFVEPNERFWLVDSQGWAVSLNAKGHWAVESLPQRAPLMWQSMRAMEGRQQLAGDWVTWQTISLGAALASARTHVAPAQGARWQVVQMVSHNIVSADDQVARTQYFNVGGVVALLLSLVVYFNTRLWQRQKELLQQSEEQTTYALSLVNAAPDAIVITDRSGKIVQVNPRVIELFGYEAGELLQQTVEILLPESARTGHVQQRDGYIAQPHLREMGEGKNLMARRKDGRLFPVKISLNGFGALEQRKVIAQIRDISEERAIQQHILELNEQLISQNDELECRVQARTADLAMALERAEHLTQVKSDFLANMSHEIRTPMNAILGLAYLLQQENLPHEADKMVGQICNAGRSLQIIINDILDYSKLQAGRVTIENIPFRLNEVFDNLAVIMAASARHKNIDMTIVPPSSRINLLRGDGLRLGQVLINLTSNAIKFTEQGFVSVVVEEIARNGEQVRLRFSVRDSGIGISPDVQQEIFAPFSQADSSTTRRFGGTGLGLSISRQLVSLMGGEIGLHSVLGQGSDFYFELSFEGAEASVMSQPEMAFLRVLIADDQETQREALRRTTESMGWRAVVLESGLAVLEYLRNNPAEQVDAIVLDWKMPTLDGLETAAHIEQLLGHNRLPIVIVASAFSFDALLRTPGSERADALLTKPLTASMLYDAVAQAQRAREQIGVPRVVPAKTRQQRLSGVRILVVDDSEINREVAQRIFGGEGAQIALAENGLQAVQMLRSRPQAFDVVLMDVQMPVMDGFEATRQLRAEPQFADLPIVALTAGAFQEHRDNARSAGMTDFIPKPFEVEPAIALIVKLAAVAVKVGVPADTNVADVRQDLPNLDLASDDVQDLPGIALRKGMKIWGEIGVYRQYLRKFIRDYVEVVSRIPDLTTQEAEGLVHKLKGAAGNLYMLEVSQAAVDLMAVLREGGDIQPALSTLQQAMAVVAESVALFAPEPKVTAEIQDMALIQAAIRGCLTALGDDNLFDAEKHLATLQTQLSDAEVGAIQTKLENFDLSGAAHDARTLAARYLPEQRDE